MKRNWMVLGMCGLAALAMAMLPQGVGSQGIKSSNTGTSNIVITWDAGTSIYGVKSISISPVHAGIVIYAYRGGDAVDTMTVMGRNAVKFPVVTYDSLVVVRASATQVNWILSTLNTDGSIAGGLVSFESAQSFTLANSWDMGADKYRTFPTPLIPMMDYNYAAVSFSATTLPDTLWYQIIMGSNPMDTLSVFAFEGTLGSDETIRYLVKDQITGTVGTDLVKYIPWPTTGAYMTIPVYDYIISNQSGYPGISRYIGVRVATCAGSGVDDLRIIMTLAKTVQVGVE